MVSWRDGRPGAHGVGARGEKPCRGLRWALLPPPMRILFDQGTPVPLRAALIGHVVSTAFEMGWSELTNGDLLSAAEREGFAAFVTTDRSIRYQQNLSGRTLAILILPTTRWPEIRRHTDAVVAGLNSIGPGGYLEITW